MGISNTLKYFESKINYIPARRKLYSLRGKRIAIDASIYMWKFKTSENELGIYQFIKFINMFLRYGIIPVFIFDGKPTSLKKKEIEKRKERNRKMIETIHNFDIGISGNGNTGNTNTEIKKIEKLRIVSRLVSPEDWAFLYNLLDHYGIKYIRINGREAEGYCSYLNRTGQVDYVMTEDTDVLLYGAHHWIKNINFYNKDVIIYDLRTFRYKLKVSDRDELIKLIILFGTDFNDPVAKLDSVFEIRDADKVPDLFKSIPDADKILDEYTSDDYDCTDIGSLNPVPIPNFSSFKDRIPIEYHRILFPADDFCLKEIIIRTDITK